MQDAIKENFGEAVRKARAGKFWSQRELADRLHVKLDPTAITRIENGSRDVKLSEAVDLCRVLDIWIEDAVTAPHDPVTRFNEYVDLMRRSLLMSRKSIVKALIAVDMAVNVPVSEDDDARILASYGAKNYVELWQSVIANTRASWGQMDLDGESLTRPYLDEIDRKLKELLISLPADGVLVSEEEWLPARGSENGEHPEDAE